MGHVNQHSQLSNDGKWKRIKQIEAELKTLYQSVYFDGEHSNLITHAHEPFFEHVSDAVVLYNLDFIIKSWNQGATDIYGFPKAEAIGQNFRDLLTSTPLDTTWGDIEILFQKTGYWNGEISHRHKDGREIITETAISPLFNEDKLRVGVLSIQRDITQRHLHKKRLEQRIQDRTHELEEMNLQLIKSQQWYEALIRNFPNGIVGLVNHDLRFEIMGGAGEINLPYRGDDLVGRKLSDIMPPEVVKRDEPYLLAALEGETHVQTVAFQDGIYQVYTLPITNDDGQVISAMVMSQDVTELIQAQQTILENQERYQMLFHSIPDMVFILNAAMELTLVNQALADWFGMSTHEIQGKKLVDLSPEIEESIFYENYRLSLEDEHPRVVVGQYATSHTNTWYEARILPLQEGLLIIKRDVTLQRKVNQTNLQTEVERVRMHTRDELVHTLAHDLRTPLSTINTSLYLLEHYTDPDKQQQKLDALKKQVGHLEQMIENILLLTELDAYAPGDLSSTNIQQLVIDEVNSLQSRVRRQHLSLTMDVPDEPLYHRVHAGHIIRVLNHILDNAIIYAQPNASIHVTLKPNPPRGFTIIVKDTGIGIAPENLPHIFERFYRANIARTMNEAGNGLGLTIAQQIVELHGGNIIVTSEPDKGTEVTISI